MLGLEHPDTLSSMSCLSIQVAELEQHQAGLDTLVSRLLRQLRVWCAAVTEIPRSPSASAHLAPMP